MTGHCARLLTILGLVLAALPAHAATIESDPVFHRETRQNVAAVLDRQRNRVVAFGGSAGTVPTFDLQVLDLVVDRGWRPVAATGFGPPDDSFVQGIYDPSGDRMLVLSAGPAGNRVFALNLATWAWTELHPTGTAPPLAFTGAAYDSRRSRVVGFGGFTADSSVSNTWALTLGPTPAWVDLGHAPAPPRYQHVAVYDSTGDRLLVVDGFYFSPNTRFRLDDVWQLDLSGTPAWSSVAASGNAPAAFSGACGIFDEAQHRLVVFGGRRDDATSSNETRTLTFPGGNATWTLLPDPAIPPQGRSLAIGLYDPLAGRLLVTGGSGNGLTDDRLWERPLGPSPGAWATAPIAGIVPFSTLAPILGTTVAGPAAYESSRGAFRMLLRQDDLAGFELRDESGRTRWRRRAQVGSPPEGGVVPARPVPGPVDAIAGKAYAFTGDTLYVLHDGEPDTWTRTPIAPTRSTPYHGAMVWLDAPRDRLLGIGPQGQLWILGDLGGSPNWTLAQSGCVPCARSLVPMAYDSARDRVLLTGGSHVAGDTIEVWSLQLPTLAWTRLEPSGFAPTDRYGHSETYDPVNDRLVLAGGRDDFVAYDDEIWTIQFAPNDAVGRFERFDLGAQRLAMSISPPTVDLPGLGGFTQALGTQRDLVRLGAPAGGITVQAQSPQTWNLGSLTPLFFSVRNLTPSGAFVSWSVRSSRSWPGFPVTGSTTVSGQSVKPMVATFVVPDSAAFGGNPLTVVVFDSANPDARDSTAVLLVDPDVPGIPLVTGPGDWIWKPGLPDTMPARLVNRSDAPEAIVVSWTVDRAWPGFAGSDTFEVQQGDAVDLRIPLVVPDTAAAGVATMTLLARLETRPEAANAATVHLHDVTTPTRLTIVEARPETGGEVLLTWWSPQGAGVDATIQRRTEHGAWENRGNATSDASGLIAWRDADANGGRFAYRAGSRNEWSEETWVDVPGGSLAFVGTTRGVLRGALRADVRLASDAPARLDAFDVRGRRVASLELDHPGAGTRHVELGPAAPGIYFLRLSQGGQEVRTRAVVLGRP